MSIEEALRHFNLSQKQARIYLAAIEVGAASVQTITKKAGVQRTHFYDLIGDLLRYGLVQQIRRGKRRYFVAAEPEKLLEIQEERLKELRSVLLELKSLYNTAGHKPRVLYYEGQAGIEEISNDTLRYRGEIVAFSTPRFLTTDQRRLARAYIERRITAGNRVRVIAPFSEEFIALAKRDREELRETRLLPAVLFESNVEIGIYGNRMFIIDYQNEFGFIVEGSSIATPLKMIFEMIWDSGKIIIPSQRPR